MAGAQRVCRPTECGPRSVGSLIPEASGNDEPGAAGFAGNALEGVRTCSELWPQTGGENEVCSDQSSFYICHPMFPAPRPQSAVSQFHTLLDFAWRATERFTAGPLSRPFSGSFLLVQDTSQSCGRTGSRSVAVPVSTWRLTQGTFSGSWIQKVPE